MLKLIDGYLQFSMIFIVAIPATCLLPTAALGFLIGFNVWYEKYLRGSVLDLGDFFMFGTGAGGILGIMGLWIRLLIPMRSLIALTIVQRVSISILLFAGSASIGWLLLGAGVDSLIEAAASNVDARNVGAPLLTIALALLAVFGIVLGMGTLVRRRPPAYWDVATDVHSS